MAQNLREIKALKKENEELKKKLEISSGNNDHLIAEFASKSVEMEAKFARLEVEISNLKHDNVMLKYENSKLKTSNRTFLVSIPEVNDDDDDQDEQEFPCPSCDKSYLSKGSLNRHFREKHAKIQTPTKKYIRKRANTTDERPINHVAFHFN